MDKDYALYLLKKTRQDYDLIAEQFSNTRRFVWRGFESLANYVLPKEKVLDLGCGNGRLLQLFREIEIDYTGTDSSEKLINIAKRTYPNDTFQVADALDLPFPPNSFDKVYSVAVLHHIPSERLRIKFIEEAKRVLKPEGLLVLTVWDLWKRPDTFFWVFKFFLLKIFRGSKLDFKDILVPWQKKTDRYIHCFTKGELKKIVEKTGMKIKEVGTLKIPGTHNYNIYIVAEK
jgi:tRNA (uracil-5-)-methyltransferase TRM9